MSDLKAMGQDMATIQERFLHTLGNLTIVSPADNARLGAKRFQDKADLYRTLGYKMTIAVPDFAAHFDAELLWGAEEIKARAFDVCRAREDPLATAGSCADCNWSRPPAGRSQR